MVSFCPIQQQYSCPNFRITINALITLAALVLSADTASGWNQHLTTIPKVSAIKNYNIPTQEYDALYALYTATRGEYWNWKEPYSQLGYPWNFTTGSNGSIANPCADQWQGIGCSSCETASNCHVTTIRLEHYRLRGYIPPEIGNLTHLTALRLNGNNLSEEPLPLELCCLFQLQELYATTCFLKGTIPPCIGQLHKLINIVLRFNFLTQTIPPLFNLTSIKYIEFDNNHLTGPIPDAYSLSTIEVIGELAVVVSVRRILSLFKTRALLHFATFLLLLN